MKSASPEGQTDFPHAHGSLSAAPPAMRASVLLQFAFVAILVTLNAFFRDVPAFATLSITFISIFFMMILVLSTATFIGVFTMMLLIQWMGR
jgi:hypothetical protein